MILFTPQKLEWAVDEDLLGLVRAARSQLDSLDADTDLEVFSFSGYGKEFIKNARCSPDAWLQMSLQLTMFRYCRKIRLLIVFRKNHIWIVFRLNGSLVPTYESASTRRFRFGRVDCIRAAHPEVKNLNININNMSHSFSATIHREFSILDPTTNINYLATPLHCLPIPPVSIKSSTN